MNVNPRPKFGRASFFVIFCEYCNSAFDFETLLVVERSRTSFKLQHTESIIEMYYKIELEPLNRARKTMCAMFGTIHNS